jgi:hypothetical protein
MGRTFLGAFAYSQKVPVTFIMFVYLSVCLSIYQHGSHWTNSHEIGIGDC